MPEHTREAYGLAIEQGADVVEPDLVFTKDGALVARHDRYLSTTTNVAGKPEFAARKRANADPNTGAREDWWVEDFTLAELKTLRARQPFPGRSKEHDDKFLIPTFDEVLAFVTAKSKEAGRPVGVYPETKHPAYFASIGRDFEAPFLSALKGFDAGPVFIQSFEPEILKRLKGKTSAMLVQLVYEKEPGAGPNIPLAEIATYADGVGAEKILALDRAGHRTNIVSNAHDKGLFIHLWTLRNDVPNQGVERAVAMANYSSIEGSVDPIALEFAGFYGDGADGVFADFPDTAAKWRDVVARNFEK